MDNFVISNDFKQIGKDLYMNVKRLKGLSMYKKQSNKKELVRYSTILAKLKKVKPQNTQDKLIIKEAMVFANKQITLLKEGKNA